MQTGAIAQNTNMKDYKKKCFSMYLAIEIGN
jgi:hypothetical protein